MTTQVQDVELCQEAMPCIEVRDGVIYVSGGKETLRITPSIGQAGLCLNIKSYSYHLSVIGRYTPVSVFMNDYGCSIMTMRSRKLTKHSLLGVIDAF